MLLHYNVSSNYSLAMQWSPVNIPRLRCYTLNKVLLTNMKSGLFHFVMYWKTFVLLRSHGVGLLIQNNPGNRPNFSQIA